MHHLKNFNQVVHVSTKTSYVEYNDPETGQYNRLKNFDDKTKVNGIEWSDLKKEFMMEDLSDETLIEKQKWSDIKKDPKKSEPKDKLEKITLDLLIDAQNA